MAGMPAIPSVWQGTTSNLSRSFRQELASNAATALLSLADPSAQSSEFPLVESHASAFAVLALQDYHSGNSSWVDVVTNGIQRYYKQSYLYSPPPRYNNDAIYWGLVFFYAYRTYNQDFLLNLSITAYEATYSAAFINTTTASSGIGAGRSIPFASPSGCADKTVAGGVFYTLDIQNDTLVNGETVSPFMTLSAYLYEHTKDPTYAEAARLSLDFILNHLWNGTIVRDALDTLTCTLQDPAGLLTSDQAWLIEGLSVWANVTSNDTLTSLLNVVVSSSTTLPFWSAQNGVIIEDPGNNHTTLKGIFIRALAEARARNPDTDLADYIEAYTMVQFNSILDNARSPAPNNNFYSQAWIGSPDQLFSATANIAALDVLNAAISLAAPTTASSAGNATSTISSAPGSPIASEHSRQSKVGAIVGGVVGGTAIIIALVAGIYSIRHHRSQSKDDDVVESMMGSDAEVVVEPFDLPFSNAVRPSKRQGSQIPDTSPAATLIPTGDVRSTQVQGSESALAATEGNIQSQEVPDAERLSTEIPTLIRRLNNLFQWRGEPPPAYEQ